MAFALVGFFLWLAFVKKENLIYLLKIVVAFLIVLALGALIDFWFYGNWTFTPWNYFRENILEGAASNFGESPWYYYFEVLYKFPTPFIGLLLLGAVCVIAIYNLKNVYLWCLILFVVGHSFVGHKEERFLFPIIYLLPILVMKAYSYLQFSINSFVVKALFNLVVVVFVVLTMIGTLAMSQKAAGLGRMAVTKHIHDNYGNKKINLIACPWSDPYNPWKSNKMNFYVEKNFSSKAINSLCDLNDSLIDPTAVNFFVFRKKELYNKDCIKLINEQNYLLEMQSIPAWIEMLNAGYGGLDAEEGLMLYRWGGNFEQ